MGGCSRTRSLLALLLIIMQADKPGAFATAEAGAGDQGAIPQLPPPSGEESNEIPKLKLGETIRFEDMGPIILNVDGTTRRIANWDKMTDQEQKATWRRISKRNEERRKQLLQQAEAEEAKKEDEL